MDCLFTSLQQGFDSQATSCTSYYHCFDRELYEERENSEKW